MLLIRGSAQGPTAEFLRFIDKSPVGERIDRFTEDMLAIGNGHLDLNSTCLCAMWIRPRCEATSFSRQYDHRHTGIAAGFQVNGRLKVSEKAVVAPEITGQVLGGPMRLSIRNEGERVNVVMGGTANVKEARRIFDTPLFESVAG